MLYELLVPYNENMIFTQLTPFEAYHKERRLNVSALEEMNQRRKLQLAKAWQQLAQSKIEKADELRILLTRDQAFSMTEAERLETISQMQDYLLSSQQLNEKADQLIRESSAPSFQKQQLVNSLKLREEREVMAGTPLY